MKIDQHEIYQKLLTDYPWLFENSQPDFSDEEYRRHFKLERALWFPYVNYYDLSILDALKDNLVMFTGMSAANSIVLREIFQISPETHATCIVTKHPHELTSVVVYFDITTRSGAEFVKFCKDNEKYEFRPNESKGFSFGIPPK